MRVLMLPDYRDANPYQRLLADALGRQGVEVLFVRGYRRGLPLLRAAKSGAVDILHLHWLSPYTRGRNRLTYALYSLKLCLDACLVRGFGTKLVWTIHNRLSHDAKFPRQERILRRAVAAIANVNIAHSTHGAGMLAKDLAVDRREITVIPHGHYRGVYGLRISRSVARERLKLPDQGCVFLHLGMIRPYKGLEDLIESWTSSSQLAGHTLLIAGEPMDAGYERELVSARANCTSIRFEFRRIADEEISLYFSAADAVVLPFRRVLTSGSLLLAMSYGCPVIAPKFDEIVETVGTAGALLYDRGVDAAALRAALELAASGDIDLAALAASTVETCNALDWDRIATLTKISYLKALQKEPV